MDFHDQPAPLCSGHLNSACFVWSWAAHGTDECSPCAAQLRPPETRRQHVHAVHLHRGQRWTFSPSAASSRTLPWCSTLTFTPELWLMGPLVTCFHICKRRTLTRNTFSETSFMDGRWKRKPLEVNLCFNYYWKQSKLQIKSECL